MKPIQHHYFHITNNHKTLKNGTNYTHDEILKAYEFIKEFNQYSPTTFFELVKKCRFDHYELKPEYVEALENPEVLKHNMVIEVVKDVILSSVTGRSAESLEVNCPFAFATR